MSQYRKQLTEFRKQINIDGLYRKEGVRKISVFILVALILLSLITILNFYSSYFKSLSLEFIKNNSQIINILLSFLLFLITSIYVFLTYKYVLLTKKLIIENSMQRVYEIRPHIYIDLFKFKLISLKVESNEKITNWKENTYKIEFEMTIHCYGKGPAVFPNIEFYIPVEDSYIRNSSIDSNLHELKSIIPDYIQPLSKINFKVTLTTNINDLNHIKDDFLKLVFNYKDISGNSYTQNLFYSANFNSETLNFFNLLHESISMNSKLIYIMDKNYYGNVKFK